MTEAARAASRTVPAGRDLTLDLTRVACVVLVVFVHILFTGVGRGSDGSLIIERTVEGEAWFNAVSWIANIMPLFFVVGGYAARAGWASALRRGDGADLFVRLRLARLARPALPVFAFFTVALGAVALIGLDPGLVRTIAIGVGSPLWFLAAYAIAQSLAPRMIRLHARFGFGVLAVLLLGALAVDLVRFLVVGQWFGIAPLELGEYGIGQQLFGLPNVLFVWLFAQQIGFLLYDGWFARRRVRQLLGIIAVGYLLIWGLVSLGGYSWNMLSNQWPPTAPLAVLAAVQAAGLTILHRPLTALMRTRIAQGAVLTIGSRLMTVYLWHLPMILALTGLQLVLPFAMPQPGSAVWWWTRVPFLVAVLLAVWLLSLWLVRFERTPGLRGPAFSGATPCAVLAFAIPILGVTAYGLNLPLAAASLATTACALALIGGFGPSRSA